jgi:hypothetical protein
MLKSNEEVVKTVGEPKEEDRFTAVFQGTYLEWGTGNMVNSRWAYDRLRPSVDSAIQSDTRVNPAKEQKLLLPEGSFEIFLGHKELEILGNDPLMAEQQKGNVIEVYLDGKLHAVLRPGRMLFGEFPGVITVKATKATAILHMTAFPC